MNKISIIDKFSAKNQARTTKGFMKKYLKLFALVMLFSTNHMMIEAAPALDQSAQKSTVALDKMVNLNLAEASEIAVKLDGVGMSRAQAIIDYRETHGPFKSVDDLILVKGIGEAILTKNRDRMRVN